MAKHAIVETPTKPTMSGDGDTFTVEYSADVFGGGQDQNWSGITGAVDVPKQNEVAFYAAMKTAIAADITTHIQTLYPGVTFTAANLIMWPLRAPPA